MGYLVEYFKYVVKHKVNVFKVCWAAGLYAHAFTHDLSKFLPSEFFPYAEKFYSGRKGPDIDDAFEVAKVLHYKRNLHHPEYWGGERIPLKYIEQFVADIEAMCLVFGGTSKGYLEKNRDKFKVSQDVWVDIMREAVFWHVP